MPVAHIRTMFKRLPSFDANAFVSINFAKEKKLYSILCVLISNCMFANEASRPGPPQAESQLIVFWRQFFSLDISLSGAWNFIQADELE